MVQMTEEEGTMTDVVSSSELIKRPRAERSRLAHQAAETIERLQTEASKYKLENWHLREKLREAYEALEAASRNPGLDRVTRIVEAARSGEMHELRSGLGNYLEEAQSDLEGVMDSYRVIAYTLDDIEKKLDRFVNIVNHHNKRKI
jgi:DNA repair ATPase RecN